MVLLFLDEAKILFVKTSEFNVPIFLPSVFSQLLKKNQFLSFTIDDLETE